MALNDLSRVNLPLFPNYEEYLYKVPYEQELVEKIIKPIQEHILALLKSNDRDKDKNFNKIIEYIYNAELIISEKFDTITFERNYLYYYWKKVNFTDYIVNYNILKSIILTQLDVDNQNKIDMITCIYDSVNKIDDYCVQLICELPLYMTKILFEKKYLKKQCISNLFIILSYKKFNIQFSKNLLNIIHSVFSTCNENNFIKYLVKKDLIPNLIFRIKLLSNTNLEYNYSENPTQDFTKKLIELPTIMDIINIISHICNIYNTSFIKYNEFINLFHSSWKLYYSPYLSSHFVNNMVNSIVYDFINDYIKKRKAIHIISNQWCNTMHQIKYVYCKMKLINTMIDNGIENINPFIVELIQKRNKLIFNDDIDLSERMIIAKERHLIWLQLIPLIREHFVL